MAQRGAATPDAARRRTTTFWR
eukprot:gene2331-biopygen3145